MTVARRPSPADTLRVIILDDYPSVALDSAPWSRLGDGARVEAVHEHLVGPALLDRIAEADVLVVMRERTALPADLLARLPRLKLITTMGAENAAIDVAAAAELGITVAGFVQNSPATAELSWALTMAVARDLRGNDADVRAGQWQRTVGIDLAGSTLGLVGLGRLGGRMADYARVFGMTVVAWSENLTAERAAEHGAELAADLDDVFRRSDIVSVHLKLSERTRGLIRRPQLELLGRHGRLVNTSRGPIVDEADLVDALRDGTIAAAALDVFDREPLPPGHPLLTLPTVLLSPHIGYVSRQALRGGYTGMLGLIEQWRAGGALRLLT